MAKLFFWILALISVVFISTFANASDDDEMACGAAGWRYSPHSQKCYKLFNERTGWTVAEFKCVFMGAHHISVKDVAENQFISGKSQLAKQAGIVWLGSAQFGTSQNYVWSDGTPFSFEHWKNNQRPKYHRGKKCSKLDGQTGDWLQSCCKVPAATICQKPASLPVIMPTAIIEEPLEQTEMDAEMKKSDPNSSNFRRSRAMRSRR